MPSHLRHPHRTSAQVPIPGPHSPSPLLGCPRLRTGEGSKYQLDFHQSTLQPCFIQSLSSSRECCFLMQCSDSPFCCCPNTSLPPFGNIRNRENMCLFQWRKFRLFLDLSGLKPPFLAKQNTLRCPPVVGIFSDRLLRFVLEPLDIF